VYTIAHPVSGGKARISSSPILADQRNPTRGTWNVPGPVPGE
jgi:hypothetical protein